METRDRAINTIMNKGIDNIIKQVKEKLGKSADAGDYIDDFKKSE